tara:strand:+ start:250 stop:438 length:189 start_codon:yes stop_codon:yes gene_type:complete
LITNLDLVYTGIGAIGIYLAHGIENKIQKPDEKITYNIDHINRIALYWTLGALAYFAVIRMR